MATRHAVVDGSNLATEGRAEPSLRQLDEAVRAFAEEYNFTHITVVVDATFEHRVAPRETRAARKAIDEGDIITPPAGVIGRGDAFILQIADKANAVVVSNDSFQEFHGTYRWLFDEGRLIGGKPVPGVGWIYVARSPVRGPVSRRATSDGEKPTRAKAAATKAIKTTAKKSTKKVAAATSDSGRARSTKKAAGTSRKSAKPRTVAATTDGSNKAAPWRQFQRDYPVGSTVAATIQRFSSHGAYATIDGLTIYLPNRLLGDPAPSRARDVLELGQTADFIVHRFDADRRGIDAGLSPIPGLKPTSPTAERSTKKAPSRTRARKSAAKKAPAKKQATTRVAKAAAKNTGEHTGGADHSPAKRARATKSTAKKATTRRRRPR